MFDYLEGRRACEEALKKQIPIRRALILNSARLDDLVSALKQASVPIEAVDKKQLDQLSRRAGSHGAHQGIICEVQPYHYADIEEIARAASDCATSLVLVCDHICDEGNLGALIRTAEVVGACGVVIPSKRAAQVSPAVYKTSAGAVFHIPIARVPNLVRALGRLKEAGCWIVGCSEHATRNIWHTPLQGRCVLVMGNEEQGISRLVEEQCDFLACLPQRGHVESLNVAQATCALCYEWLRQNTCIPIDSSSPSGECRSEAQS